MRPLHELLTGGLVRAAVEIRDVRAIAAWQVDAGREVVLTAPEGSDAGRITIAPRRRPVASASELLGAGGQGERVAFTTVTSEGEYASMAGSIGEDEAVWIGAVHGDDFVYVVEGRADAAHADRLAATVKTLVSCASLGLGELRSRPFLHAPPGEWRPEVSPTGETIWHGAEGATITVFPGTPKLPETPSQRLHRQLVGDPYAAVRGQPRGRSTPIHTRAGLRGVHVMGDGDDSAILEDERFRYMATISARGAVLRPSRAAFARMLESIVPLPAPHRAAVPVARATPADHWIA